MTVGMTDIPPSTVGTFQVKPEWQTPYLDTISAGLVCCLKGLLGAADLPTAPSTGGRGRWEARTVRRPTPRGVSAAGEHA
jgi:hypothetical protein